MYSIASFKVESRKLKVEKLQSRKVEKVENWTKSRKLNEKVENFKVESRKLNESLNH